ncbi:FAD-dependent oxidoreductase [Streptosporangium carneum]|uniref:FAD-binding monooxygenase n=1 Tax=Streptosporangium carneum TaxID=47481 RepID=A0A9W6HW76_9ACTN|nr:NAD(P)-binding protein [Streptosporangium carneum]GLK07515.1 FAD-binding monooxygenase [Streptosporangium carneum]
MTHADRAVVIGSGMGGLLAARALSETYAEVVVVDRDLIPEGSAARKGVPQGRQLHVLLARGREAFDTLFPGMSTELARLGSPLVDLQHQVHWYNDGHRMRRAPSPLLAFGISRPLLEHTVRARVAALPGVRLVSGCEVLGLTATPDSRRVTGVRVLPRGETAESVIDADMVVDAGGRASRSPIWLEELGYARAPEERVQVDLTYVTRVYKREPHHLDGLLGALTNAVPGLPRGGIVAVQEDDRLGVALSGVLGEEPPTDDEGMVRYAETLAAPQIAEIVRSAVPVSAPAKMRFPASVRRRYERLRRFPGGYLVTADALCGFNPVYGQGMTVAALEALLLRRLIASGTDDLARRFFRGAARLIDAPWSISVGTDLRFPEVEGRRSMTVRLVNAYVGMLHAAAVTDPALGAAFIRVLNLIDPPARLMAPATVFRVLRGTLGRRSPLPMPAWRRPRPRG